LSLAEESAVKCGFYGDDATTNTVLPTATWKYLVWVWNGSTSQIYVDGASIITPKSHGSVNTTGTAGRIGASTFGYDFYLTGQLDEVRIASVARSAASISAEFNNQKPDSSFIKALGDPTAAAKH